MRNTFRTGAGFIWTHEYNSEAIPVDALGELGRATTAYFEAPPDRVENAREEYEEALRRFRDLSGEDAPG